jgi:hypothetical protein
MAKTVNYTPEQEARLLDVWKEAPIGQTAAEQATRKALVAQLAEEMGKKPASIRGKLSRLEVYIPTVYTTKKGEKPTKKADLVAKIAEKCGKPVESFDSLEKANAAVLKALLDTLS